MNINATIQTKKDRPNYFVVLDYKDDLGKRKMKWITTDIPIKGNNKRKVEERRKEILSEYEQQPTVDFSKDILFTVFIEDWLENLKPSISPVTYDGYRLIIHNQIIPFYQSNKLKVKDVTPLHIQQYIKFKLKTVSPNTVRKHLWNMSKCFDSAIRQKLIQFNPVKGVDMPKKVRYTGAQHYDEKQIDQLLSVTNGDIIEGVVMFAVFYGLRREEIIGLKWDAVNFDDNTFTIKHTVVRVDKELHKMDSTKNKSSYRTMPMSSIIIDLLKKIKLDQAQNRQLQPHDYIDEGYIFTHTDGRLILPDYVTKRFKNILIKNNMPIIRLHDLRHPYVKPKLKIF